MVTFNCNTCDVDGNCTCEQIIDKKKAKIQKNLLFTNEGDMSQTVEELKNIQGSMEYEKVLSAIHLEPTKEQLDLFAVKDDPKWSDEEIFYEPQDDDYQNVEVTSYPYELNEALNAQYCKEVREDMKRKDGEIWLKEENKWVKIREGWDEHNYDEVEDLSYEEALEDNDLSKSDPELFEKINNIPLPKLMEIVEPKDKINHPSHYTNNGNSIEPIDFIESWNMNFSLGSVVKYICRKDIKHDSPKEDLLKAHWYLTREIKRLGWLEDTALCKEHKKKMDDFSDFMNNCLEESHDALQKCETDFHEYEMNNYPDSIKLLKKKLEIEESSIKYWKELYNKLDGEFNEYREKADKEIINCWDENQKLQKDYDNVSSRLDEFYAQEEERNYR